MCVCVCVREGSIVYSHYCDWLKSCCLISTQWINAFLSLAEQKKENPIEISLSLSVSFGIAFHMVHLAMGSTILFIYILHLFAHCFCLFASLWPLHRHCLWPFELLHFAIAAAFVVVASPSLNWVAIYNTGSIWHPLVQRGTREKPSSIELSQLYKSSMDANAHWNCCKCCKQRQQLQLVSFLSGKFNWNCICTELGEVQLLLSINKINLKQLRFFHLLQRSLDSSCSCGTNTSQLMGWLCVGV